MENRTNKTIKFSDNEKYLILKHAVFKGQSYYLTAKITPDGKDVTDKFAIIQENERDGKLYFNRVTDLKTLSVLIKYLGEVK